MNPNDWLSPQLPDVQRRIVLAAHADIGQCEDPPGSNRGAYPDKVNRAAGSPLGSPWCAGSVTWWFRSGGAEVPPIEAAWWRDHKLPPSGPGSCDAWWYWSLITHRFTDEPREGYAVLYGDSKARDSNHMGVVFRVRPVLATIEANTALEKFSREGLIVDQRPLNTTNLLGYVSPFPLI